MGPEVFNLEKLKSDFNLPDNVICASGLSADDLEKIYYDYYGRLGDLEKCKNDFISEYILGAKNIRLHSHGSRVKDPYHLLEKIIRKKHNNFEKYEAMQTDDYFKYITDLIGCRILLVYKEDWERLHEYLVNTFDNIEENYINKKDYSGSYQRTFIKPFMAERPVAYIRPGDYDDIYRKHSDLDINREGYYRSVHYIIRLKEYYIELQVRSLYEEAWGEVDHDILYPLHKDNSRLVKFSQILNRIAGVGDELSDYFKEYAQKIEASRVNTLKDTPPVGPALSYNTLDSRYTGNDTNSPTVSETSTPQGEMHRILQE